MKDSQIISRTWVLVVHMKNMTNVYYADSDDLRAQIGLERLSKYFCESDRARALRYRRLEDGYNFLLGRMLLRWGLRTHGFSDDLTEMTYSKAGKPMISAIHFNLSHSANVVGCAFNKSAPVGLDVEQVSEKQLNAFRSSFTESEWMRIKEAANPLHSFLQFWTRKEAIIKALDITLGEMHAIELDGMSANFFFQDEKWYIHALYPGSGFFGACCAQTTGFREEEVPINLLMQGALNN